MCSSTPTIAYTRRPFVYSNINCDYITYKLSAVVISCTAVAVKTVGSSSGSLLPRTVYLNCRVRNLPRQVTGNFRRHDVENEKQNDLLRIPVDWPKPVSPTVYTHTRTHLVRPTRQVLEKRVTGWFFVFQPVTCTCFAPCHFIFSRSLRVYGFEIIVTKTQPDESRRFIWNA